MQRSKLPEAARQLCPFWHSYGHGDVRKALSRPIIQGPGFTSLRTSTGAYTDLVLRAVLFVVALHGLFLVFRSVQMVGVCQVGMMRRFFVVASYVMFGRLFVMFRSMLVMLRRFFMVFVDFVSHGERSSVGFFSRVPP